MQDTGFYITSDCTTHDILSSIKHYINVAGHYSSTELDIFISSHQRKTKQNICNINSTSTTVNKTTVQEARDLCTQTSTKVTLMNFVSAKNTGGCFNASQGPYSMNYLICFQSTFCVIHQRSPPLGFRFFCLINLVIKHLNYCRYHFFPRKIPIA